MDSAHLLTIALCLAINAALVLGFGAGWTLAVRHWRPLHDAAIQREQDASDRLYAAQRAGDLIPPREVEPAPRPDEIPLPPLLQDAVNDLESAEGKSQLTTLFRRKLDTGMKPEQVFREHENRVSFAEPTSF